MIRLERMTFAYAGQPAILEDVSLTLPDAGVFALMGPSGSAKTTFLRLLAGLEVPQSGAITGIQGRKVILLFQEDRLLPWCTVLENMQLAMPNPDDEEARRILQLVELGDSGDAFPKSLSGGMKRRAAQARAVAARPDILLLDEPFNGLNVEMKQRIAPALRAAAKLIVFTTHDPAEAEIMKTEQIFRIEGKNILKL